jgi:tetratricopeptide (TPR) repeat protein
VPESPVSPFQALDAENWAEYQRLERLLRHGGQFQLIIISYTFAAYRQHLIARIAQTYPTASTVTVTPEASASQVIDALVEQAKAGHAPVHLSAMEGWIAQQGFAALHPFNYRREYLAETLKLPLIVWLPPSLIPQFASELPDLWAWRTAVLEFHEQPVMEQLTAVSEATSQRVAFNTTERLALEKRLQELQAYLKAAPQLTVADAGLLLEVCDIEERFGHWGNAIEAAKTASDLLTQAGTMSRELAVIKGRLADILARQGQLDEALRIRTEEVLPVYRQLGDVRSVAVTQGQIADILMQREALDEALRICTEEVLPAFQQLGDVRSVAVTQGKIADILMQRGELDEALVYYQQKLVTGRQLSDQNMIASALFSCARVYLAQEEPAATAQEMFDMLSEAFQIVKQLQRPDGIVAIGLTLAQVLILAAHYPAAEGVLATVAKVARAIGSQGGPMFEQALASVQQLRAQIGNNTGQTLPEGSKT